MIASTTDGRCSHCDPRLFTSVVLLFALGFIRGAPPAAAQSQDNDVVLQEMTAGTAALMAGDTSGAEHHFNVAVQLISHVWGTTPAAERARSLWYEEKEKPFKGDPYERMMAYYYRGLLFLFRNDFGNAQAAFRNAVLQDAFAEEQQYNHDVVLPLLLQGWALEAQGSIGAAREAYGLVAARRPDFLPPSIDEQPSLLIVAETGTAPRKVPDGVGSYKIKYFRGKGFSERRVLLSVDGAAADTLYPLEDIYWQATSRGGREVDWIFEGKAEFAEKTDLTGSALTTLGQDFTVRKHLYGGDAKSGMGVAADVLGLAGIAALALSSRARPAADTRYWDNLPDAVHVGWVPLPPGEHTLHFGFLDGDGNRLSDLQKTVRLTITPAAPPRVLWLTSRIRRSRIATHLEP